jgi:hypothetical protein
MAEPLTKEERFNIQTWPVFGREKELIDAYEATVVALEAELDGYRAKGGAFFEDAASFEAKKRADAEAEVARLEELAATRRMLEDMPDGWGVTKVRGKFHAGSRTLDGVHGSVKHTAKEALEDAYEKAKEGSGE